MYLWEAPWPAPTVTSPIPMRFLDGITLRRLGLPPHPDLGSKSRRPVPAPRWQRRPPAGIISRRDRCNNVLGRTVMCRDRPKNKIWSKLRVKVKVKVKPKVMVKPKVTVKPKATANHQTTAKPNNTFKHQLGTKTSTKDHNRLYRRQVHNHHAHQTSRLFWSIRGKRWLLRGRRRCRCRLERRVWTIWVITTELLLDRTLPRKMGMGWGGK